MTDYVVCVGDLIVTDPLCGSIGLGDWDRHWHDPLPLGSKIVAS